MDVWQYERCRECFEEKIMSFLEQVQKAFEGHSTFLAKEIHSGGKYLCRIMVGGQSFTMSEFTKLYDMFLGYEISFMIDNGVLAVIISKDEED